MTTSHPREQLADFKARLADLSQRVQDEREAVRAVAAQIADRLAGDDEEGWHAARAKHAWLAARLELISDEHQQLADQRAAQEHRVHLFEAARIALHGFSRQPSRMPFFDLSQVLDQQDIAQLGTRPWPWLETHDPATGAHSGAAFTCMASEATLERVRDLGMIAWSEHQVMRFRGAPPTPEVGRSAPRQWTIVSVYSRPLTADEHASVVEAIRAASAKAGVQLTPLDGRITLPGDNEARWVAATDRRPLDVDALLAGAGEQENFKSQNMNETAAAATTDGVPNESPILQFHGVRTTHRR